MKKPYKIPFYKEGGQLVDYTPYREGHGDYIEWKDNYTFQDEMRVVDTKRGRSAAHFVIESCRTGTKYTLFLTDALTIFQKGIIVNGVVSGWWTFVKRGSNYGLKLYFPISESNAADDIESHKSDMVRS